MRRSILVAQAALAVLASANFSLPALGPGMPTSQRRPRPTPDADDQERLRAAEAKRAKRAAIRARAEPVTREQRRAHDEQYPTRT